MSLESRIVELESRRRIASKAEAQIVLDSIERRCRRLTAEQAEPVIAEAIKFLTDDVLQEIAKLSPEDDT